ncbi:MAG: glycosyltransferase family 2 protein, partial [Fimbriimonas sp.]
MSSPLVSVILTSYNHLNYIEEAITSVRNQTFQDYEFIAIDDGSTDGTRDFLATQPNIKLILNEQNLGTYASLNKA